MLDVEPGRFLVIGHRGSSIDAMENTLEAFQLAAEQGADGVELDVRRTADGNLVVHHNGYLFDGRAIVDITLAELKVAVPHVPTFEEAMEVCRGLIVNVEIKNWIAEQDFDSEERVAQATADWLDTHGWEDQVIVSSFNPRTIDTVKAGWPGLATAQLLGRGVDPRLSLAEVAERGHQGVNPNYESLLALEPLIGAAGSHNLWLIPWTVDEPEVIQSLASSGTTGVFTNDPAAALNVLSRGPQQ